MKKIMIGLIVVLLLCFTACHAVNDGESIPTLPSTTAPQATDPTTVETVPTEPAKPKELVSEAREGVLVYDPYPHQRKWSGRFSGTNICVKVDESLYPGKTITYRTSTNYGRIIFLYNFGSSPPQPLENKKHYAWSGHLLSEGPDEVLNRDGAIFVDVVIYADESIIGYGIFEIGGDSEGWLAMMRTEAVLFPMIDGQLQEVPEEYVAGKLAELKQTVTPFDREAKEAEYLAYLKEKEEQEKATEPSQP